MAHSLPGLLDALKGGGGNVEVWTSALFDFYRATGRQARFEAMALDFAERSGRSAPAWFSMPEQLGQIDEDTADAPLAEFADQLHP